MCYFLFLIFVGTISGVREFYSRSSEAEKLIGLGKKIPRLPPEERFLEPIQKDVVVSQVLCLLKLKINCIYGNQGLINNLRAESI